MFLLFLFFTSCNALAYRHPPKYTIIKGEPYINYYTLNGYTGFDKMDTCEVYEYDFNNHHACCVYRTITKYTFKIDFYKNISTKILQRRLINSLRNTPTSWAQLNKKFNNSYTFEFLSNDMFKGDKDNLIEEFTYLDYFKSYNLKKEDLICKKSKFELIQEHNDEEFVNAVIIIFLVCLICSCLKSCLESLSNNTYIRADTSETKN